MRRKSDILQKKGSMFSIYLNFNMESNTGDAIKIFEYFQYLHQNSSSSAINKAVFRKYCKLAYAII